MGKLFFAILLVAAGSLQAKIQKPDPWYYQDSRDLVFAIPDKAQHFYGSAALAHLGGRFIPRSAACAITIGSGLLWELKDNAIGIGFSWRDLTADCLGALSGSVFCRGSLRLWIDYDINQKWITLNVGRIF